ncbi:hypothetical protein RYH80_15175 [Halobaculum sp. MBLA0147]|uniref:hypothetical protein n=1 Tax=Halobaculum sp. MBLA0147 TaxID=3079934 RepID=UPI0035236428
MTEAPVSDDAPEVDPTAETPHECLGLPPEPSRAAVKLAAARAKSAFNPDGHPEEQKRVAREWFYVVRSAEAALLEDGEFPPSSVDVHALTAPSAAAGDAETDRDERGGDTATPSTATGEAGASSTADGHDSGATAAGTDSETTGAGRTGGEAATQSRPVGVSVDPRRVIVGEPVSVSVTAGGDPVATARVETTTGQTVRVADGWGTFVPETPGEVTVRATTGDGPVSDGDPSGTAATTVTVVPDEGLSVVPRRETVAVGEPVTVDVRDAAGNRVDGGRVEAVVGDHAAEDLSGPAVDGAAAEAGPASSDRLTHGTGSVAFDEPGERTVAVHAGGRTATATVDVVPAVVDLVIEPSAAHVTAGETVRIAVRRRFDGRLVSGASVRTDRGHERVAEGGRVSLRPTEPGPLRVTATYDAGTTTYDAAETTIEVGRPARRIAVESPDSVTAGEAFAVVVRDDRGERVSGVPVSVRPAESSDGAGSEQGESVVARDTTDTRGRVTLSVSDLGAYRVVAGREPTASDTDDGPSETGPEASRVVPTSRPLEVTEQTTQLAVAVVDPPTADDPAASLVVRDQRGTPVAGATVAVGDAVGETDDTGRVRLSVPESGSYPVTVRKTGDYETVGDTLTVSVDGDR